MIFRPQCKRPVIKNTGSEQIIQIHLLFDLSKLFNLSVLHICKIIRVHQYQNLPQKITVSIKFVNNHTAPYCLQSGTWQLCNKEPSFPLLTLQESAAVPTQDVVYMCGYNLQASS